MERRNFFKSIVAGVTAPFAAAANIHAAHPNVVDKSVVFPKNKGAVSVIAGCKECETDQEKRIHRALYERYIDAVLHADEAYPRVDGKKTPIVPFELTEFDLYGLSTKVYPEPWRGRWDANFEVPPPSVPFRMKYGVKACLVDLSRKLNGTKYRHPALYPAIVLGWSWDNKPKSFQEQIDVLERSMLNGSALWGDVGVWAM